MIHIDSLNLRLPTGFQHRASNITRLITTGLGEVKLSGEYHLDNLSTPMIRVPGNSTDGEIAQSIVTEIVSGLKRPR